MDDAPEQISPTHQDAGNERGCAMPRPVCPVCGGALGEIRGKLQCERCHTICETCCEGGRG